jgi:hypothetical protein
MTNAVIFNEQVGAFARAGFAIPTETFMPNLLRNSDSFNEQVGALTNHTQL